MSGLQLIAHTGYELKRSLRIHTRRSSLPPATSPPLFVDTDMQPNSTATEVSAHLSEVSPDPSTNMPGSQTTATATSARDNLPAPRRPQPIFSATYMHKQLPTTFSIHAHMHFQRNIYSPAQLILVSTSTAQLLASQDINRLFRLCVHLGPASSHISQPLVASFDKTATAQQTEQQ